MYSQNVELRHLRYFVAVAEELHFSRAAAKLQIAQPPLSQQIRQLERILGVRLFERNYHAVTLTTAGQVFLDEARIMLDHMEHAFAQMQAVKNGLIGRLDIGFSGGAGVTNAIIPAILQRYCQRFQTVEVRLSELGQQEQVQALHEQQIQLGFVWSAYGIPDELEAQVIERIPLVAVVARQHRLANEPLITLDSLVNEPFIFCQRQTARFLYDRIIRLCGFSPRITQEVTDNAMLLGLVAANLGVSIVPASLVRLHPHDLVVRPLADMNAHGVIESAMLWRRQNRSPLLKEFLVVANEVLSHRADHPLAHSPRETPER